MHQCVCYCECDFTRYLSPCSIAIEGTEACKYCHASWHHPHSNQPHFCLWICGKEYCSTVGGEASWFTNFISLSLRTQISVGTWRSILVLSIHTMCNYFSSSCWEGWTSVTDGRSSTETSSHKTYSSVKMESLNSQTLVCHRNPPTSVWEGL